MNNLDPQTIASVLLVLRIIAFLLIGAVLVKQVRNMRNLVTDYPGVRITVFVLTLVLFVGQIIPITLDTIVAFTEQQVGRTANPSLLGVAYAGNNAIKDVVIGALLYFLHYRNTPPTKNTQTGV